MCYNTGVRVTMTDSGYWWLHAKYDWLLIAVPVMAVFGLVLVTYRIRRVHNKPIYTPCSGVTYLCQPVYRPTTCDSRTCHTRTGLKTSETCCIRDGDPGDIPLSDTAHNGIA